MDLSGVVGEIQLVLAPAVMISSSALLLLGFQTKFSNLANRFRALNHEKRELAKKERREGREEERYLNLSMQVEQLLRRATQVKNAILLAYAAISFFLVTSVLIFVNIRSEVSLSFWIVFAFLAGLILELIASIVMMVEVNLAFKVVRLESTN